MEGLVPNEDTWGDIYLAVIGVEFLDGGASLSSVILAKNFPNVTEQ